MVVVLTIAIFAHGFAHAQSNGADETPSQILTDEQDRYPLGPYLDILEDPSGELTIEDVASSQFDSQFLPNQVDAPNFGLTDSAYWVRLNLNNQTRKTAQWLLEAGMRNMQYVDLYTPAPGEDGFSVRRTGALRPPSERDIRHPRMILNLDIPPDTEQTSYVRFQSGTAMSLPLTLWTPDAFWTQSQLDQLLRGQFFGALLALLAYNLFVFLSLREKTYLYLVVLLASMTVFEAGYAGYTEIYLIPNLYYLKPYYQAASFSLIFASMLLFADAFLDLKNRIPKFHWATFALLGVWGALLLLTPFVRYRVISSLMIPWALVSLAAVLAAGTTSWLRGRRDTRFFMIAWSGLLFAFVVTILTRLGVLTSTVVTENAYRLGLVWMAVCWSIALADRINMLKADVQQSEFRLSQILEGLPLGVVVYGKDFRPNFINRRVVEILSNPAHGIRPDISAGRTLSQAMDYFAFRVGNSDDVYPFENMPVYRALQGEAASADDLEADLVDRRVPLEVWASPVTDNAGNVESAVVAFQDITRRKSNETELAEYRNHLENLVQERTVELTSEMAQRELLADTQRKLIAWLSVINHNQQSINEGAVLPQVYGSLLATTCGMMDATCAFVALWHGQVGEAEFKFFLHPDSAPDLTERVRSLSPTRHRCAAWSKMGNYWSCRRTERHKNWSHWWPAYTMTRFDQLPSSPSAPSRRSLGYSDLGLRHAEDALTEEQTVLLSRMARDLANIGEYARLYDSAQELAAADERNRLARDLHDSVTQVLFSATLIGGSGAHRLAPRSG